MQKKYEILSLEKASHIPSLYTVLSGVTSEGKKFSITAYDVIFLARQVILGMLRTRTRTRTEDGADGSISHPFALDNHPLSWLQTSSQFKPIDLGDLRYFKINEKLFSVNERNRYMAYHPVYSEENTYDFLMDLFPSFLDISDEEIDAMHLSEIKIDNPDNTLDVISQNISLAFYLIQSIEAKYQQYNFKLHLMSDFTGTTLDYNKIFLIIEGGKIKYRTTLTPGNDLVELEDVFFLENEELYRAISENRLQDVSTLCKQQLLSNLSKKGHLQQCFTYPEAIREHSENQNFIDERFAKLRSKGCSLKMTSDNVSMPINELSTLLADAKVRLTIIVQSREIPEDNKNEILELMDVIDTCLRQASSSGELSFESFNSYLIEYASKNGHTLPNWLVDGSTDRLLSDVTSKIMASTPKDINKAKKINDLASIREIRAILIGTAKCPKKYLYPTFAPLFFSEPSRYLPSFFGSIMLLDLIQGQQCTPDTGDLYSIENLLANPEKRKIFYDAYGVGYGRKDDGDFVRLRKVLEQKLIRQARLTDQAAKEAVGWVYKNPKSRQFPINEVVMGYHPMVQGRSFFSTVIKERRSNTGLENLECSESNPNFPLLNLAQQKLASIMLQWISLHLGDVVDFFELKREILSGDPSICEKEIDLQDLLTTLLISRLETFYYIPPNSAAIVQLIGIIKQHFNDSDRDDTEFLEAIRVSREEYREGEEFQRFLGYTANFEFEMQDVHGDGNCFFRAISQQLQTRYGITHTHQQLREIAATYMLEHYQDFSDFLPLNEGESKIDYFTRMFRNREWADEPIIAALARALDLEIVLVRDDQNASTRIGNGTTTQRILYLGYQVGRHYLALNGRPNHRFPTAESATPSQAGLYSSSSAFSVATPNSTSSSLPSIK